MLEGIEARYREDALTLLRWLAYARSPRSVEELVETTIIDPSGSGTVNFDDRGDLEDTLSILAGLVTVIGADKGDYDSVEDTSEYSDNDSDQESNYGIQRRTCIRLAHFSVQEFLESKRIIHSKAKDFYLDPSIGHRLLTHSCLIYLEHYSGSSEKTGIEVEDLAKFPLLKYAANSWMHHSLLHRCEDISREIHFLASEKMKGDWLSLIGFNTTVQPGLYYASSYGLETVVRAMLDEGSETDVNVYGGPHGNALQAAACKGHEKVVQILLHAGAEVNAQGGYRGNAVSAASLGGHDKLVKLLIEAGADFNARSGDYGNAIQAASFAGHGKVVRLLIEAGADVNARNGKGRNALQAAAYYGYETIVQLLLDAGAEVNALGDRFGSALLAASSAGHTEIVQLLLNSGAEVNAQGDEAGGALQGAARNGHTKIVQLLLNSRAEVNAQGTGYLGENALQAAASEGHTEIARMLIDAGANISAQSSGSYYSDALQAASAEGHLDLVQLLLDAGAHVNAAIQLDTDDYGNVLMLASAKGYKRIVQILLDAGAHVNAHSVPARYSNPLSSMGSEQGSESMLETFFDVEADVIAPPGHISALTAAVYGLWGDVVQLLVDHGAEVDVRRSYNESPLAFASRAGNKRIVRILIDAGADVNAQFAGFVYCNALEVAMAEGNDEVVQLLKDAGAVSSPEERGTQLPGSVVSV